MGAISLESDVWPALGTRPDPLDDGIYTAGEQPIASYDNWAMWAVTKDIDALNEDLDSHVGRHEVGGSDELNLQNLAVNDVAVLNGDSATGEFRLVDPDTSSSVTRVDLDDNKVRQWPAFAVKTTHTKGLSTAADITHVDTGTAIYDETAGSDGKFHHAKEADHAQTADMADDADLLDGFDSSAFLRAGQATATITGDWTYNKVVDADIAGNAATADHADTADSATWADNAGYSDDSDMVDGYHAQQLIDEAVASAGGNWTPLTSLSTATPSDPNFFYQAPTPYDRYKIVVYHEAHHDLGKPAQHMRMRVGAGGSVDWRTRYHYRSIDFKYEEATWYNQIRDHFRMAMAMPGQFSVTTYTLSCPQALNNPGRHWPTMSTVAHEAHRNADCWFQFGALETSFNQVDTFRFNAALSKFTGQIDIYGQNLG